MPEDKSEEPEDKSEDSHANKTGGRRLAIWLSLAVIVAVAYDFYPVATGSLRAYLNRADQGPSLASEPAPRSAEQEREDSLGLGTESRQRIQIGLRSAGFEPGPTDGSDFDSNARDAIRNWQASRGVQPTGFLNAAEAIELAGLGNESAAANGSESSAATLDELNGRTPRLGSSSKTPLSVGRELGRDGGDVKSLGTAPRTQDQPSPSDVLTSTPPSGQRNEPTRNRSVPSVRAQQAKASVREKEPEPEVAKAPLLAPPSEVPKGPGRLTARANATGAMIQLDGGRGLELPLRAHNLSAGSYRATVSAFGFETFERDFDIAPDEETMLDVTLEPTPFEALLREARDPYLAEDFKQARDGARKLLTIHPEEGAALLLLGESLYGLGEFQESTVHLRQAIRRGEAVALPTKHRHGGLGLREGFCQGTLTLSKAEVSFRSRDQAKHGFTMTPSQLKEVVVAEKGYRNAVVRIDTKILDRGKKGRDFDFMHWKTERVAEDRDNPSLLTLQCRYCDASMNVQAELMQYLYEISM